MSKVPCTDVFVLVCQNCKAYCIHIAYIAYISALLAAVLVLSDLLRKEKYNISI